MRTIRKIFLHHSGSSINTTVADIRRWHTTPPRNWSDIGYHWLILGTGELASGRPMRRIPAAQLHNNTGSIAICTIGNFERDYPLEGQIYTLDNLLFTLCKSFDLSSRNVYRHKDVNNTDCPGKFFPFEEIIAKLAKRLGEKA